jgi:hypothetical protein
MTIQAFDQLEMMPADRLLTREAKTDADRQCAPAANRKTANQCRRRNCDQAARKKSDVTQTRTTAFCPPTSLVRGKKWWCAVRLDQACDGVTRINTTAKK